MAAETFHWSETAARLTAVMAEYRLEPADNGTHFAGDGVELVPPLVQPIRPGDSIDEFLESIEAGPGLHAIVLLRAGATALGLWRDDELLRHKAFKRYVVRAKGRAQPTHLASKGKSRYGSRLRLQNARRQLEETNERLAEWVEEFGAFRLVLAAAPQRLWSDLRRVRPEPPFGDDIVRRIPFHTHTPCFEELRNVRRRVSRGRIVRTEPA